ncbi:hypothetical protein A0J61_07034 [Choanephora cucurbitarum]|uniref:Uncharacterized protein n=1 Tax=Choanephora cucurbitarum TaxID=101091 RepID=A0A1C7N8G3_9FUNG|nr:hypothetical protein A0J61_07034 [Choanephora cucurbitarum]
MHPPYTLVVVSVGVLDGYSTFRPDHSSCSHTKSHAIYCLIVPETIVDSLSFLLNLLSTCCPKSFQSITFNTPRSQPSPPAYLKQRFSNMFLSSHPIH